jgi:TonB family protein
MNKTALVILAALSATIALAAEDFKTVDEKEAAALAVNAPRPNYPYEARAHHLQGSGIAILTVDPATGNVTNVVMRASTGVPSLDDAAISTFRRWRFKPGIVTKVRVPINFVLSGPGGPGVSYVVGVVRAPAMDQVLAPFLGKGNVIKASLPRYPLPWTSKQGRGVYEIHVNQAGTVTEVKILKASGDLTFDSVTVNTLHQWRLHHGPKIIELPLAFVMTPDNCRIWIP